MFDAKWLSPMVLECFYKKIGINSPTPVCHKQNKVPAWAARIAGAPKEEPKALQVMIMLSRKGQLQAIRTEHRYDDTFPSSWPIEEDDSNVDENLPGAYAVTRTPFEEAHPAEWDPTDQGLVRNIPGAPTPELSHQLSLSSVERERTFDDELSVVASSHDASCSSTHR
jgi:hypothetical protein